MDTGLVNFMAALRRAGLPISSDETIAAAQTLQLVGYDDRERVKQALSLTLAKSAPDKQRFDECFERFYRTGINPEQPEEQTTTEDPTADDSPELTDRLSELLNASPEQLQLEVQQAGTAAGTEEIRLFTQRGVFLRRIMDQLAWSELQQALLDAGENPGQGGGQTAQLRTLAANIQALARDHVDRQYALHGEPRSREMRDQMLMQTRINQLDPRQIASCRRLVARIVRRLTRHFKRRKRYFQRGSLDLHRTLRHNMAYEGTLVNLRWRRKHKDRPKVFVLCDVSGSVRQYAELMLLFVYSLQDILPRAQCYAFANRLDDISELLKTRGNIEQAIEETLRRIGGGATDYAGALEDFKDMAGPALNRRSVIIILGDARNNQGDPALETFRAISAKAGTTYWLNPESHFIWNTGDSVIDQYQPYCDGVFEANTLEHLERFCELLLRRTL